MKNYVLTETMEPAFWEVLYGTDALDYVEEVHWFEKFDKRSKKRFDDEN